MAKQIVCECGEVARGQTDDELIANAEEHVRQQHPEQVGTRSRADWLALATLTDG